MCYLQQLASFPLVQQNHIPFSFLQGGGRASKKLWTMELNMFPSISEVCIGVKIVPFLESIFYQKFTWYIEQKKKKIPNMSPFLTNSQLMDFGEYSRVSFTAMYYEANW